MVKRPTLFVEDAGATLITLERKSVLPVVTDPQLNKEVIIGIRKNNFILFLQNNLYNLL